MADWVKMSPMHLYQCTLPHHMELGTSARVLKTTVGESNPFLPSGTLLSQPLDPHIIGWPLGSIEKGLLQ